MATLAGLHVAILVMMPEMARNKDGLPPYLGQWIVGSLAFSTLVLAAFAIRVGDRYDRFVASAFCALPLMLIWDIFHYGFPRG